MNFSRRNFLKTSSAAIIAAATLLTHPAFGSVGGIFDAVATYGADPTGATISTVAINRCIADAGAIGTGGVVWIEPGTYIVNGGCNLANLPNGVVIRGGGMTATYLRVTDTTTNAIAEIIGSSNVVIEDLWLDAGTSGRPNYGIILTTSSVPGGPYGGLGPSNVFSFNRVVVSGYFNVAAVNIFFSTDGAWRDCQFFNYNPSGQSVCSITAQNVYGATSTYANIAPPPPTSQSGDWTFDNLEIHEVSARSSGFSNVLPLYISGTFSKIAFVGGLIAGSVGGSNGGTVTFDSAVTGVSFLGVQFYADLGSDSNYCFFARSSMTGLVVENCDCRCSYAIFGMSSQRAFYRITVNGNGPYTSPTGIFMSVVNSGPNSFGALQYSNVDAQGMSINLGTNGYLTNTYVTQHGTIIAANQSSNTLN